MAWHRNLANAMAIQENYKHKNTNKNENSNSHTYTYTNMKIRQKKINKCNVDNP